MARNGAGQNCRQYWHAHSRSTNATGGRDCKRFGLALTSPRVDRLLVSGYRPRPAPQSVCLVITLDETLASRPVEWVGEKRLPAHPTERKQQKDRQEWSLDSVCLVQRFSGPKGLFTSRKLLPVEVRASSVVVLAQAVTAKAVTGTAQTRVLAMAGGRCAASMTTRRAGPVRGVPCLLRAAQHLASSSPVRIPPSAASAVPILLYVHAPTHARSCTYGRRLVA